MTLSPKAVLPWVIGLGVCCRVRQYAASTSLWHDESFVALNVLRTPFTALLGPLDWHEPSPPGFLAIEKVITGALGDSEYALRLLPLLAGIAAVLVFVAFARRVCRDDAAVLWAVTFVAVSPKLIAHCNEVKHFTLDTLATVGMLSLAWRAWETPQPRRIVWMWAATAAVAAWFSYASVFVFAATSAVLATRAYTSWNPTDRRVLARAHVIVLLSLVALAWPVLQQRTGAVVGFWNHAFADTGSTTRLLTWLARAHLGLFDHFWQPFGALTAACVALATIAAWQDGRRALLATLWLPVLLALAASFLHLWPFGGNQHMVFAAPIILLLAGRGAELARSGLAPWRPRAAVLFMLLLLAPGIAAALYHLVVPRYRHELRPVIRFMQAHGAPTDAVIAFDPATFAYYTGRDVRHATLALTPKSRVWVITPRGARGDVETDVKRVVGDLSQLRPRLETIEVDGAAGYLFGPIQQPDN